MYAIFFSCTSTPDLCVSLLDADPLAFVSTIGRSSASLLIPIPTNRPPIQSSGTAVRHPSRAYSRRRWALRASCSRRVHSSPVHRLPPVSRFPLPIRAPCLPAFALGRGRVGGEGAVANRAAHMPAFVSSYTGTPPPTCYVPFFSCDVGWAGVGAAAFRFVPFRGGVLLGSGGAITCHITSSLTVLFST